MSGFFKANMSCPLLPQLKRDVILNVCLYASMYTLTVREALVARADPVEGVLVT